MTTEAILAGAVIFIFEFILQVMKRRDFEKITFVFSLTCLVFLILVRIFFNDFLEKFNSKETTFWGILLAVFAGQIAGFLLANIVPKKIN